MCHCLGRDGEGRDGGECRFCFEGLGRSWFYGGVFWGGVGRGEVVGVVSSVEKRGTNVLFVGNSKVGGGRIVV